MKTVLDFKKMKQQGEKIAMVTVYDYTTASVFNETSIDCLLVGDTLAMVMHGFSSTIHATTQLMAFHTAAVSRGAPGKFITADMPFLSFRKGRQAAMEAVDSLMKAGASAVKVEGVEGTSGGDFPYRRIGSTCDGSSRSHTPILSCAGGA